MKSNKLLKVMFFGGVGEIGKNMTALEYGDNILVVDAGMGFPNEATPGVDVVIPDIEYLKTNSEKVVGIVLTHGHEDHVGALPYVLKDLPQVPVYGTRFTLGIAAHKLENQRMSADVLSVVPENGTVEIGPFSVEFIKVCHSIAGAAALSITTPAGIVFFTGDYKMDYTPIDGKLTNIARIEEIGKKGVLLMLGESTNVERQGHSKSERRVGQSLEQVFVTNSTRRIIIATFATNNYRVQQIMDLAKKYGRKVLLSGRSMKFITELGKESGELHFDSDILVDAQTAKKMDDGKVLVISTGTQGEPMSALAKMSQGEFDKITVSENDTVVLSSSPIPGNERSIYTVINNLYRKGAEVMYEAMYDIHTTGHAFQEELKLMLQLVKPKYFIPVHGEYRHLKKNAELAKSLGIPAGNVLICEIGNAVALNKKEFKRISDVPAGNSFVDGNTLGENADGILRDRINLSKDGMIIVVATVEMKTGKILSGPEIIARGFDFDEEKAEETKEEVSKAVAALDYDLVEDYTEVKAAARKAIRQLLKQKYKQYPMILPIIIEG